MTFVSKPINQNNGTTKLTQKLMVHGFVCPESSCTLSTEVRRGMAIRSKEGLEVGKVAAVVLNSDHRKATHILLDRLPEINGYWLVPIDLIAAVCDEAVQLAIPTQEVEILPRWHST